jgi:hypothetical protein
MIAMNLSRKNFALHSWRMGSLEVADFCGEELSAENR